MFAHKPLFIEPDDRMNYTQFSWNTFHHYYYVKMLLRLRKKDWDPSIFENHAIKYAYEEGYDKLVTLLLKDVRVDGSFIEKRRKSLTVQSGIYSIDEQSKFENNDYSYYRFKRLFFNSRNIKYTF